jgi:arabinan endo-1,5-alpha-L-arabinosidase
MPAKIITRGLKRSISRRFLIALPDGLGKFKTMSKSHFERGKLFLRGKILLPMILFFPLAANGAETKFEPQLDLQGQTFIHDPSTIAKDGGKFYVFGTLPGVRVLASPDLIHWTNQPHVFARLPSWTKTLVPDFTGTFWAPDIIRVNGKFLLYYAVSTWGKQTSAIGLATNPTLDASAKNYLWTDRGAVIASGNDSAFNAIDPSVMQDADGKLWLAFGSYWQGIFLTELDPQTGLRTSPPSPLYQLAWNHEIEAACLTRHDDFYYLFVNWGQCCRGTNSSYEVRIGRAKKIIGPYLDRDGKKLADGGGSIFLQSSGRFIGPGHIGILNENGTNYFSYHYYDAATKGRSRLAIGKLDWSSGWPVPVN